jgi:hypothetical protein
MVVVHVPAGGGVDGAKGVVVTGLVKDDVVVVESQATFVPTEM